MILVDSSVWIDYFNGRVTPETDWLESAIGIEVIILGDLILTEVLQGFYRDKDFLTAKELLMNFPFMEMLGKELALESAGNYRRLKKKGSSPRKTVDVIIGTFCLHYGFSLLHDDRDFEPLVRHLGLRVIKP
jgi:predicted nucleic acid-binding protein